MDADNIHADLLSTEEHKSNSLDDNIRSSSVSKSWNSVPSDVIEVVENKEHYLSPKYPCLLLAEDTGADTTNAGFVTDLEPISINYYYCNMNNVCITLEDNQTREYDNIISSVPDLFKDYSSVRGLYCLATRKTYNLDLPEATNKLILGTNKGWLVTLGRDLEINLLHPLTRDQISLPPMLTLPNQYEYDDDFPPQEVFDMFISKVAMSSSVPTKSALQNQGTSTDLPIVMAIYGEQRILGFARLGDESWTDVESDAAQLDDVVYHNGNFYAIDFRGSVVLCEIDQDDKGEKQNKGVEITSFPYEKKDWEQCYLIESLCRSHLWMAVRIREGGYYEKGDLIPGQRRYYTSNFLVFKLEVPSCTWTKVEDLGNEALFIGKSSSVSVASSEFIKPNSIYFTDDEQERYCGEGGHDMGIFDLESGIIEPHFEGVSVHPFSPPLWYI